MNAIILFTAIISGGLLGLIAGAAIMKNDDNEDNKTHTIIIKLEGTDE